MAVQRTAGKRAKAEPKTSSARLRGLAIGLIGVGLALLVAGLFALGVIRLGGAPQLTGAIVNPPFPAPDFKLNDQFDQPVALSSYRGKVVVLTFLYTNCPDACPLITEKIHQAYDQLGGDTNRLAILAVTVDPQRDTTAQVRAYSVQKDMLQKWHFLVGTPAQLAPVWSSYGIEAVNDDAAAAQAKATALAGSLATPTALATTGIVDHSSPTFIIDPSGKARAVLDVNFAPSDLVQDVKALE
jgi:protein SCO1/2